MMRKKTVEPAHNEVVGSTGGGEGIAADYVFFVITNPRISPS